MAEFDYQNDNGKVLVCLVLSVHYLVHVWKPRIQNITLVKLIIISY